VTVTIIEAVITPNDRTLESVRAVL